MLARALLKGSDLDLLPKGDWNDTFSFGSFTIGSSSRPPTDARPLLSPVGGSGPCVATVTMETDTGPLPEKHHRVSKAFFIRRNYILKQQCVCVCVCVGVCYSLFHTHTHTHTLSLSLSLLCVATMPRTVKNNIRLERSSRHQANTIITCFELPFANRDRGAR